MGEREGGPRRERGGGELRREKKIEEKGRMS